jgi:hypothetical protein
MPSYGSNGIRSDGSSMNSGNQISARSSTRVHQQPGGNSSFSLGWGDPSNATKVTRAKPTYAPAPQAGGAAVFGTGGYGGGYGSPAPAPYGGGGGYGGNGGGYSGSDYVPKSLNTAPAQALHRGDSLESMAGPMGASPMSRMRGGNDDGGYGQPTAVSPNVARAAAASSRRTGIGYNDAADAFGARGDQVSSNSYASGANQNSGNVITDRSSTRVAQQPGGNSSFSLGWSAPDNAAPRQQTGRRQIPQQQQQQAFVYGQQAPPPQQQPYQPVTAPYGQSSGYGQSPQQPQYGGGGYGQQQQQQQQQHHAGGAPSINGGGFAFGSNPDRERGSSNAFANGASQNTGNFISDRSSTRIHAPPGGRSSLTIG